ncbi:MAG: NDP-sugar synthase [Elusimicrobia bacterium]|nr:NDP-sugar synthase [Elusimicrobiota bacterium]
MVAVIVAGGRGERMRALARGIPKPMLPINGRPLLEHQLRWLRKNGFRRIFLCLGYRGNSIRRHFKDGGAWGVCLRYRLEKRPLGTAGCVRPLSSQLRRSFLVVYGDLYARMGLDALQCAHQKNRRDPRCLGTLVLKNTDHPSDSDLAAVNSRGRILRFFNKPHAHPPRTRLANAAVYLLEPKICSLIPSGRSSDFARDIFPNALARGHRLYGHRTRGLLQDIGTPGRYREAQKTAQRRGLG